MSRESFLGLALREFRQLKSLADAAIAPLSRASFATPLGDGDNTVAA